MRIRAALALVVAVILQAVAVQADLPGPPAAPSPAAIAIHAAPASSPPADWTVNRTAIGLVIDQLGSRMFGVFEKFTTRSVQLAQALFMSLAGIELGWTLVRWFVSNVPLDEYVANSLFKIVQLNLLFTVISNSYSSPFGPGWFFMIVNGIVGMAQDTAGFNVVGLSSTGQFTPSITPGTILDIGLRLFTLIMTAASTGTNAWDVVAGLTSGATMMLFGRWCFCLISACAVVVAMAWIAFRWLWVTLAALWQGTMVFLTGFTGSRVTSSIGYGPFNAAFAIGVEMAAHVVIIGLFYPVVTAYVASVGFGQALQNGPLAGGTGPIGTGAGAALIVQIGAVLLLDLGVALWAYAIKRAPDLAAGAISGTIRLSERDALEGARGESMIGQSASALARVGAGGVAGVIGGASGDGGPQPTVQDRMKGAFAGAVRGGLMAGPEGALGGAAVGAATARGSGAQGETAGRVRGGAGNESAPGARAPAGGFTGGFVDRRAPSGQPGSSASGQGSASESPAHGPQSGAATAGPGAPTAGENETTASAGPPTTSAPDATTPTGSPESQVDDGQGSPRDTGPARAARPSRAGRGARVRDAASAGPAATAGEPIGADGRSDNAGGGSATGDDRRLTEPRSAAAGPSASTPREADTVVEALTRALQENTVALRGQGAGSTAASTGGGQGSSGPLGGLGVGPAPQNAVNMMLYRQLLSAGRRQKQDIHNERPAVSLGVSHIE